MGGKLTQREKLYAEHRARGLNCTEAMRALGFKGKRPDVAAAELERRPRVQAAIEKASERVVAKLDVTHERWFEEVWGVASAKVKSIKPSDKNKALELAGRHLGAFKDTAGERDVIGPGLTIIIQPAAATIAGAQPATVVAVQPAGLMPPPEQ